MAANTCRWRSACCSRSRRATRWAATAWANAPATSSWSTARNTLYGISVSTTTTIPSGNCAGCSICSAKNCFPRSRRCRSALLRLENEHTRVAGVGDHEPVIDDAHALGPAERVGIRRCRAAIRQGFLERRLANDLVGRLEGFARPLVPHQYAIVQLIGDEQLAVRHRHAPRIIQRARARLRVLAAIAVIIVGDDGIHFVLAQHD